MEKNCSECGSKFSCDNNLTCWCASFPKISQGANRRKRLSL